MGDFVVSYRPKPACAIGKDFLNLDGTNLGRWNPGKEPNTVKSVYALSTC